VSAIEIRLNQWPVCFVKWDGESTPADLEGYIASFNKLHDRRERFAIISYIKRYKTDRDVVARIGRWFQEVEPLIRTYWASNAMVSPSPGFRFVLSGVYLIKPLPIPSRVCATPEEAIAFTRSSWHSKEPLPDVKWPF
jgi:hypothetical protein